MTPISRGSKCNGRDYGYKDEFKDCERQLKIGRPLHANIIDGRNEADKNNGNQLSIGQRYAAKFNCLRIEEREWRKVREYANHAD